MRVVPVVLVLLLSGCLATSRQPQMDSDEDGAAVSHRPAYYDWFPKQAEGPDALDHRPDLGDDMLTTCCGNPLATTTWGPFHGTADSPGHPAGTVAHWIMPYRCSHSTEVVHTVTVWADGREIGHAEQVDGYETITPIMGDQAQLDIEVVLGEATPGSILALEFTHQGCMAFGWGTSGSLATRLSITPPQD